jgi:hypothetical protein
MMFFRKGFRLNIILSKSLRIIATLLNIGFIALLLVGIIGAPADYSYRTDEKVILTMGFAMLFINLIALWNKPSQ